MSLVRCLYCDAENDAVQSAGYCEGCGKKLPPASLAHKRREPALHEPAGIRVSDEERRRSSPTSSLLFTIAILQLLGGGALLILLPVVTREPLPADFMPNLILYSGVVCVVFAVLGWWARSKPLLAGVVAAVVYVGLAMVDTLAVPGLALRSLPVKIIILVLLIQAIRVSRTPRRSAASGEA